MHAKVLPWTVCLPTLVLIAQTGFLLERGQTNKQTDATERRTPCTPAAIQPAWVNKKKQTEHNGRLQCQTDDISELQQQLLSQSPSIPLAYYVNPTPTPVRAEFKSSSLQRQRWAQKGGRSPSFWRGPLSPFLLSNPLPLFTSSNSILFPSSRPRLNDLFSVFLHFYIVFFSVETLQISPGVELLYTFCVYSITQYKPRRSG